MNCSIDQVPTGALPAPNTSVHDAREKIGSVDAGTTQTDDLAIERERGITIRSAVASFEIGDLSVNLIDTPGHPDFIAEVERVLSVLDAAVLVVSAVEGIQPQTPLLMRALQRQRVPTLLFINKIDRAGADTAYVVAELRRRLALEPIALGHVVVEGTREARYIQGDTREARVALVAGLAEHDDGLLRTLVAGGPLPSRATLHACLARQVRDRTAQPVIMGSATLGVGIDSLIETIATIMPVAATDTSAPASGRVFKIERTLDGAKSALVRLYAGRISVRDQLAFGNERIGRVTHLRVFAPGGRAPAPSAHAGQIAVLLGLGEVRVGDIIGEPPPGSALGHRFPPPTLESVVAPLFSADRARMRAALTELADQDPLINVRQDDERDEISVSLYGDVQRQVIQATLEDDYNVRVSFRRSSVLHIERPAGVGTEEQLIRALTHSNISGRSSPDSANPYRAALGVRIEPGEHGSGVHVVLDVDVHLVPMYVYKTVAGFAKALSDYTEESLREGPHGWQVTDCLVTVWDSGYVRTGSTARDFRMLAGQVVRTALERAGTVVCQPMTLVTLEVPAASAPGVMKVLGQVGSRVTGQFSTTDVATISAVLDASAVEEIKQRLPGLTSGQGLLEFEFGGYQPVDGVPPERRRRHAT
ncbi:MAG: translation factor GTPase family protein [Candidatus Limnocylindrales bacterium]